MNWQPSQDALRQLSQLGVTKEFALQQIPQFVAYWNERNVPRHSWESKFIKEVWRQWQQEETLNNRRRKEISVTDQWQPSSDALDILTIKGGINKNFVEDAIPEFVLYWRDRGDVSSTWDSKFIHHVRRQWQFFTGITDQDTMPKIPTYHARPVLLHCLLLHVILLLHCLLVALLGAIQRTLLLSPCTLRTTHHRLAVGALPPG